MKRFGLIIKAVCIVCICMGAAIFSYYVTLLNIRAPEQTYEQVSAPVMVTEVQPTPDEKEKSAKNEQNTIQYVIFENEHGTIDIFLLNFGELTKIRTIDYDCSLLRTEDRIMIRNGIYLNSLEETEMLIEDFIS